MFKRILLAFIFCLMLSPCFSQENIFVSLVPLQKIVKEIAGNENPISVLFPVYTGHGQYQPSPQEWMKIKNASLFLHLGNNFELQIITPLKKEEFNIAKGISPIYVDDHHHHKHAEHDEHNIKINDPHFWLSLNNLKTMADNISKILIQKHPNQRERILQKTKDFLDKIEQDDQKVRLMLKPFAQQSFLVFHPAFGYFARDYKLNQVSIETSEGKSPGPRNILELHKKVKEQQIKCLIWQENSNQQFIKPLAEKLKLQLIQIDPLAQNPLDTIMRLTESLSKCFQMPREALQKES